LRRRGYTSESIVNFIKKIGYTKFDGIIDVSLLEYSVKEHLNQIATRVSAVIDPVKLIITNYPEGQVEMMEAIDNPEIENSPVHEIPFDRELFIEREDFMENPPKKYFRLSPGNEVRLKNAYIIKCTGFKANEQTGEIEEIYCEYDAETRSGMSGSDRKVKGTLHWVSVEHSVPAEVRLYDRLFMVENPAEENTADFRELLNPDSLKVLSNCRIEPFVANAKPMEMFQFQRIGYFNVDKDSESGKLIFNRTVPLRDSWGKMKDK
jgi:glutaminyl-tRNA synthetase